MEVYAYISTTIHVFVTHETGGIGGILEVIVSMIIIADMRITRRVKGYGRILAYISTTIHCLVTHEPGHWWHT